MKAIKTTTLFLTLIVGIAQSEAQTAINSKTQFAETAGRKIAYRTIGKGSPIVLVNRFRGTLDTWDPLFLDQLAENHRVVTFDYTGIGSSTGTLPIDITEVAKDVKDLCDYLKFKKVVLLGWSYGGFVTQAATFQYPELVSHTILIGTNPPGANKHQMEPVFFERALKPVNDLDDETILFFEPQSEASKIAAKKSHDRIYKRIDASKIPASPEILERYTKGAGTFRDDPKGFRQQMKNTKKPMLAICGDHDICFPVQNWYDMARELPTTQIIVFPHSGHGPQHQFPELSARYIHDFIQLTQ